MVIFFIRFYDVFFFLLSFQYGSDSGSMDCEHGIEITFTPLKKIWLLLNFT